MGGRLVTFSHVGDEGDRAAGDLFATTSFSPRANPVEGTQVCERPEAPFIGVLATSLVTSCPTGPPAYSQTLPRDARTAAVARRLVRTALTLWGLDSLAEDATLVMTELVSNAVDHSRLPSIRVIVSRPSANAVRVGVVDRSRALPILRTDSDGDEPRGRGLLLIDTLTDDWGTELYRWGKQVWAELKKEEEAGRTGGP
ncbi:ATP-binding protein [Streptomyces sp. adm13(2018)]|uniref:ATP-binding protein n=1 Tax=Streptomyces sp. adm13(2018) TaxID=2479007 RepID=UPI0011CD69FA|nr:ATP-binding protein [Streptomyces sp. adm13(2018)]TXS26290.1 ATP-binding protein [Streptomyces sp. adm13(2018)]